MGEELKDNNRIKTPQELEDENKRELIKAFKKIFNRNNVFNMPFEIAIGKFEAILERDRNQDDLKPEDTERLYALCVVVKTDYYTKDRGIKHVDSSGNPIIEKLLREDKAFLEKNPDIKLVVEARITEEKIKEIIGESYNSFVKIYESLSENEKEAIFNSLSDTFFARQFEEIDKEIDKSNIEKKIDNNEELSEKDKRLVAYRQNMRELQEQLSKPENLENQEKRIELLKRFSYLIENHSKLDDVTQKFLFTSLRRLGMTDRDLSYRETNFHEFERRYLNLVSGNRDGVFRSISEVKKELEPGLLERGTIYYKNKKIQQEDVAFYLHENYDNPEKRADRIKALSVLIENPSKGNDTFIIAILESLGMDRRDLSYLERNRHEFKKRYLNFVNANINGSYEGLEEISREMREEILKVSINSKRNPNANETKDLNEIIENFESVQMEEEHIEDNLNDRQLEIYKQFRDIDFSKDENPIILLKLYIDLKNGEGNIVQNFKKGHQTIEDIELVLERMITAQKNAGRFGYYLDYKNGKIEINEERVNTNIKKFKQEYELLSKGIRTFINSPKTDLKKTFEEIEGIRLSKLNEKELIESYLELIGKRDSLENSEEKYEIEEEISRNLRSMYRLKSLSTFFVNGRINNDKLKEYYGNVYNQQDRDEDLERIMVTFASIENSDKTRKDIENLKKDFLKQFKGKNGSTYEDRYEEINQQYEQYLQEGAVKNAINTIYSAYLNKRNFDSMTSADKKSYLDALAFLYKYKTDNTDNNSPYQEFAETFIKFNFPSVKLDNNGKVYANSFKAIYTAYNTGLKTASALVNIEQAHLSNYRAAIKKSKRFNYNGLQYNIDMESINNSVKEIKKENSDFDRIYTAGEQKVIDQIRKDINLEENRDDARKLVIIRNEALRQIKDLETKMAQRAQKAKKER